MATKSGPYIPPAKRVKTEKFEVGSPEHQKQTWDESKRKITGLINRANVSNINTIIKDLFSFNLIRYKGLFASALLKAQETSPEYTDVYAALLGVINSRIKTIGLLVINRLILQYRTSFVSNNKRKCLATIKFIAHLANQDFINEVLVFQIISHLLHKATPASIELTVALLKECGAKLEQTEPRYLFDMFSKLRHLSLENDFDTRTHELIELIHKIRKEQFRDYPPLRKELDLIDESDRVTHTVQLNEPTKEDFHMEYNYFKFDPRWSETESKYEEFKRSLLEETDSSEEDESGESASDSDEEEPAVQASQDTKPDKKIIDATGSDSTAFRRTVYLTIRSSARHEEVVHKLMKSRLSESTDELCQMILDCCGQERTYETIYGLVASNLCQIRPREYSAAFEKLFGLVYSVVHKFDTNRIRNIAKFYAHLLATESVNWACLSCLSLREGANCSTERVFMKFLLQELVSILSLKTLKSYASEPDKQPGFVNLIPRDSEQDIRFAIVFFTGSPGLEEFAQDLKEELSKRQQ